MGVWSTCKGPPLRRALPLTGRCVRLPRSYRVAPPMALQRHWQRQSPEPVFGLALQRWPKGFGIWWLTYVSDGNVRVGHVRRGLIFREGDRAIRT